MAMKYRVCMPMNGSTMLMIRVEGNLNNLDMSLETNSTCCGIAGGSWLIGNDDGPEELHGGAQC